MSRLKSIPFIALALAVAVGLAAGSHNSHRHSRTA